MSRGKGNDCVNTMAVLPTAPPPPLSPRRLRYGLRQCPHRRAQRPRRGPVGQRSHRPLSAGCSAVMRRDQFNGVGEQQSASSAGFCWPLWTDWSHNMTNQSSRNRFESGSAPMKLANTAVDDPVVIPAPVVRRSRNRRARPTLARRNPTVSLVISLRNEARNIAWVLESRPTEWPGVAGKGNDTRSETCRTAPLVNAACFPAAGGPRSRDNGSRAPPAPCARRTHASSG
jgi:hypothetical protein